MKTVNFGSPKYVGDPLNAVRIFNEKEVDELLVLDIDATRLNRQPDEKLIEKLATESRMPLCYGGGVNSVEQICRLIGLGVEKVAVGAAAVYSPTLLAAAAERVGSQSVVAVIDVKRSPTVGAYEVYTHNGTLRANLDPASLARTLQDYGVGEIVINSIDRDGTLQGYDLELAERIKAVASIPITILGGAGRISDIENLISRFPQVGAAAGSLFVFKGKYRAVLINYPTAEERDALTYD